MSQLVYLSTGKGNGSFSFPVFLAGPPEITKKHNGHRKSCYTAASKVTAEISKASLTR